MAKIVRKYSGWTIKETTPRDNATYKYWVFLPEFELFDPPEWECDSLPEAYEFIQCYDSKSGRRKNY